MEKKIKKLFDYQRFEKNEKLEKLIRDTENRYATELSDDDLSFVSAAGEFSMSGATIDGNESESGGIYTGTNRVGSGGGGGGGAGGGSGAAMSK